MQVWTLLGTTALLALAGCMDRGEYPSLKPRAIELAERNRASEPPPAPAPPARPEIVARAAALAAQGREGQRAFAAELARARPVIAAAGAADSESWITAQEQLSALGAARAATVTALAELDAFNLSGVDAAGLRFGANDFAAIRQASRELSALLDVQQRELATLAASLAAPQ